MKYITLTVRPTSVSLGYAPNGEKIVKTFAEGEFDWEEKVIRLDRILSFVDGILLIECPHNTFQEWDYKGSLEDVKRALQAGGALAA